VVDWPDEGSPPTVQYRQESERDLEPKLAALVPDAVRTWCQPTIRVERGKPYRTILEHASQTLPISSSWACMAAIRST
jgi:hypothetical protein